MGKAGRPTKFNQKMRDNIMALAGAGKTDQQIADALGISRHTISLWKTKDDEFFDSLKNAKSIADELVEVALFQRATGYISVEERAITVRDGHGQGEFTERVEMVQQWKQHAPDTTACIYWLNNRQSKDWRNKIEEPAQMIDDLVFEDANESA